MPPVNPLHDTKDAVHYFDSIAISVASPEQMLSWSHGEVTKPETINYRTQRAERDGLFCEKIFGPTKNFECYCGKYKGIRYKGILCERCGVEVTRAVVRRERMGHIKLAVPVTHIWFLRSTPSRVGLLLDLPIKTLEQVIYFAAYVVKTVNENERKIALTELDEDYKKQQDGVKDEFHNKLNALKLEHKTAGKSPDAAKKEMEALEEEKVRSIEEIAEQYHAAKEDLLSLSIGTVVSELKYRDLSMKFGHVFSAGIGAEAVRDIIAALDLPKFIEERQAELKKASGQKHKKIMKRLKLAMALHRTEIKPEWMILTILPIIPPDLRPMVHLDGGRFAASDLNDLYRRVINRNNRLKRLLEIGAPEVIARNEKRMLQEAVDALLNNSARAAKAVFSAGEKRKLRSLSDMLKGKQGRFRQNLLGKRTDYSGRSVIVVGPKLKLHECGLPKEMALKLFKPFVIGSLITQEYAHNVKTAEKLIDTGGREVWDALEKVIDGRYVLLNRAPTLHRLGIQAFQPVLIEGKAIQVHPLVCAAYNADFDGDQMAVHVPLSTAAQKEARELICSAKNMQKPASGEPTTAPTQDMVLGCYYLTRTLKGLKGEGMVFADMDEAILAYRLGHVKLHAWIRGRWKDGNIYATTVGRMILNSFLPIELGYQNETVGKSVLKRVLLEAFEKISGERAAQLVDNLKRIGFKFASKSGLTIGMGDMIIPKAKHIVIGAGNEAVKQVNNYFWKGLITDEERYLQTLKIWAEAKNKIAVELKDAYTEDNDIFIQIDSGARGNWGQITQLAGMKGLVANPSGKTIELPVKSSLKEGFTILEYFTATHGGRKGKSDTALKTAEAGYLTRRLVDATQDIIIKEHDCGTKKYMLATREDAAMIGETYRDRVFGRTLASAMVHPKTGEVLAEMGAEIDTVLMKTIEDLELDNLNVHSVSTCETENGICQKCYGRDLASNTTVAIGAAVGIIAAQSIGEPGTQLTMRTFHMGGVAGEGDITQGLTRVEELFEARNPRSAALISEVTGKIKIVKKDGKTIVVVQSAGTSADEYQIPHGYTLAVKEGSKIAAKQIILRDTASKQTVKAKHNGVVDKITGNKLTIRHGDALEVEYVIPPRSVLKVKNGDLVGVGTPLTLGHLNLRRLLELTDESAVQNYIVKEVQSIYAAQGQTIADKHVEVIVRQMFSKVRIIESGDTEFLPGSVVDIIRFRRVNEAMRLSSKAEATAERLLLGLTRVALFTDSWLSAASFQETIRVLVEAATTRQLDSLSGLKENVIIGKLIPAGDIYRRLNPDMVAGGSAAEARAAREAAKQLAMA